MAGFGASMTGPYNPADYSQQLVALAGEDPNAAKKAQGAPQQQLAGMTGIWQPNAASGAGAGTTTATTQDIASTGAPQPNAQAPAAPPTDASTQILPPPSANKGWSMFGKAGPQTQAPPTSGAPQGQPGPIPDDQKPALGTGLGGAMANGAATTTGTYQLGPVATGVDAIIAANSPLMQQAAAYGRDQLNARGLVNSSMAIGASQAEMLKAATPIASQEADIASRFELQKLQGQTQQAIAASEAASRQSIQTLAGEQAAAQQKVQGEQQTALTAQKIAADTALQAAEEAARLKLADIDTKSRLDVANIGAASDAAKIAAAERESLATAIANINNAQQNAMNNTMANDKIDAATRANFQAGVSATSDKTLAYLQSLYGVSVTAGIGNFSANTSADTATAAAAIAADRFAAAKV